MASGRTEAGAGLLANGVPAFADAASGPLTPGDVGILRFLAAIELIESDL